MMRPVRLYHPKYPSIRSKIENIKNPVVISIGKRKRRDSSFHHLILIVRSEYQVERIINDKRIGNMRSQRICVIRTMLDGFTPSKKVESGCELTKEV